jgi:hypothetical protein
VNFIGSHGGVTSSLPSGFSHSSDNRMKHNEVDISNGIAIVNKLKPKFYIKTALKDPSGNVYSNDHDFTEEEKANQILNRYGTYESGFIAQEVREIPELVHTVTGDEYDASGNATNLGLNYDNITPYLARAIQELHREQQADKERIASLEARIAALENT